MTKPIKSLAAITGILLMMSFTRPNHADVVGKYGVSIDDQSRIELTLNEDFTFEYQDFSNPSEIIELTGKWELKRSQISLINLSSDVNFHDKWTIDKASMRVKSRRGMTFYTLRRK